MKQKALLIQLFFPPKGGKIDKWLHSAFVERGDHRFHILTDTHIPYYETAVEASSLHKEPSQQTQTSQWAPVTCWSPVSCVG